MADYLKIYNELDVVPLLQAIQYFGLYMRRYGLDVNAGLKTLYKKENHKEALPELKLSA